MKFVIHLHETVESHYDLMVERGDALVTWRIPRREFPSFLSGSEIPAERIQDHRKMYLTYEGPVSCERGRVACYDSGEYSELCWNEKNIEIFLRGAIIFGNLSIRKLQDAHSILHFINKGEADETR